MRIVIAEDEAPQRAHLRDCVKRYAHQWGIEISLREFENGNQLVSGYETGTDLILMDIDMPGMNGMDAARHIRALDSRVMIVFCTNLVSRALDGYAVEALDFIVKPVGEKRLFETIDKARRYLRVRMPRTIALSTQDGLVSVCLEDIYYAETYGRKLKIHTAQGAYELRMPVSALEQQLPGESFFRVHNAYLVSLRHVQRLNGFELIVAGDTVPVSRHKKREFVERLTTFMGDQL